jgi:hypothetical protein
MSTPRLLSRPFQVCELAIPVQLRGCSTKYFVFCFQAVAWGKRILILFIVLELMDNYSPGFVIHIKCNILVIGPL